MSQTFFPPLTWEQNVALVLTRMLSRGMKPIVKMIMTMSAAPRYQHKLMIERGLNQWIAQDGYFVCDECLKLMYHIPKKSVRYVTLGRKWFCKLLERNCTVMEWDSWICRRCVSDTMAFSLHHPSFKNVVIISR